MQQSVEAMRLSDVFNSARTVFDVTRFLVVVTVFLRIRLVFNHYRLFRWFCHVFSYQELAFDACLNLHLNPRGDQRERLRF
ncbi:hypothetical protein GEZ23_16170 [Vibrio parahaemolyticus]|uniref:Uncharacterized protein n=1 Tax=Vibrio parahaemolyticus serotype O3:K6 (strain RIMD 2210633) TaxID=223926 RepID=Q87SX4_VIBPA|nr:hypothetical protein [Vibrio parahaemolyticus]BAC58561.1 hypothetical protein [Vibrio parahaemolyticus RIMD 2210633]